MECSKIDCHCTSLRAEFRLKKLRIGDVIPQEFSTSAIIPNQLGFIAFKFGMLFYGLVWWIWKLVHARYPNYFYFFTSYQEVWFILYLALSMSLAIQEYFTTKDTHQGAGCFKYQEQPRWYHKVCWIIHTITMMSTFLTVIVFWTLIAPGFPSEKLWSPLNLHAHIGVMALACIDLLVSDVTVRVLHCLYGAAYGCSYFLYNLSLHWAGQVSDIYTFTEWKSRPLYSATMTSLILLIAPLTTQLLSFAVYKLRGYVRRRYGIYKLDENNDDMLSASIRL